MHVSRRELLRIGAVSVFGALTNPSSISLGSEGSEKARQRSCVFILLQGGPSHLDLWDPKPDASLEVRGPFQTTATSLPGVHFGELAPRTAAIAGDLLIVRSMTHRFTNHIAGTYVTLTGSTDQPDQDREAHADDFPGPAAVLNHLAERQTGRQAAMPRSVSLPNWLSIPGPSNRMPGQYGGFLGAVYDPLLIEGNPQQRDFQPLSLSLPHDQSPAGLHRRLSLTEQLDRAARYLDAELTQRHDASRQSAYELVVDGRLAQALDLTRESESTRDRYGRNKFGQSLLLARRLIEAGVGFVGINEFNQKWDTHGGLLGRYREIVPALDEAYSALITDLKERGALGETLVVLAGEFGRTPKVNKDAGRDHWPNVYSVLLAGGGLKAGCVYGASDHHGAEVGRDAVSPADLLATMWKQLGTPLDTYLYDRLERPHPLSRGRPITGIIA